MNIIILIVGIIAVIAGIVCLAINKYNDGYGDDPIGKNKTFVALILVGIVVFIGAFSFEIIPTGYTGVRSTFGQIEENTLSNGFNWKIPFVQSIEAVNNKQQDIKFEDDEIWSETSERTAIQYKGITVTYQINPEKSAWIYANISDYENNLVSKSLVSSAIKSSSKTLSDTDATNRSVIEPLALTNIQNSLDEKYGTDVIYVNKVVINNADFEESYNQAIADKQKAQLAKEQQEIINQQNIDQAAAEAEVEITKAEGEAEAKKIAAGAEAEANKKISDSLDDRVIQNKYIEKWNGQMPKVTDSDGVIVDISDSDE
jgi:regulator of protease activity HflC (stomatin/prohibitin superfamily)